MIQYRGSRSGGSAHRPRPRGQFSRGHPRSGRAKGRGAAREHRGVKGLLRAQKPPASSSALHSSEVSRTVVRVGLSSWRESGKGDARPFMGDCRLCERAVGFSCHARSGKSDDRHGWLSWRLSWHWYL